MTSNGFDILLILVERIKRDIARTWEVLQRTTSRIETTNKMIKKTNLERTIVRIKKNERREDKENTGKN